MTLVDLSQRYNQRQRNIGGQAQNIARRVWAGLDERNIADSWIRQLPALVQAMRTGMTASATGATQYVAASLAEQGDDSDPAGTVISSAFGDSASDGRALGTLLYMPVVGTQNLLDGGAPAHEALASGLQNLLTIVQTQIADAGRAAVSVGVVADRGAHGYFREVGKGACARCAILAGKWFSTADGASFERHPRCQCTAVAAGRDGGKNPTGFSPDKYFRSLSSTSQDRIFTKAGAQAIRDGADMSQVVNARRGMSLAGARITAEERAELVGGGRASLQRTDVFGRQVFTTTEGTTVRGVAGKELSEQGGSAKVAGQRYKVARAPRLMPEAIYEEASRLGWDRTEIVRQLTRFGYIH